MSEENTSQEFRLKKVAEIKNYLFIVINQNELISKKHKKVCRVSNYIDHLFIVNSIITGCVSISAFFSLVGIPIETTSCEIGLKTCAINCRN